MCAQPRVRKQRLPLAIGVCHLQVTLQIWSACSISTTNSLGLCLFDGKHFQRIPASVHIANANEEDSCTSMVIQRVLREKRDVHNLAMGAQKALSHLSPVWIITQVCLHLRNLFRLTRTTHLFQ